MPHRRAVLAQLAALNGLGLALPGRAGETVLQLLSATDVPPFVTGPGQGLSHDLASRLPALLPAPPPRCELRLLPRRRLLLALRDSAWQGLVPWVLPAWFDDEAQQRYRWSVPILDDADLVVSLKTRPVDYDGPASLQGLTFGGVGGHRYVELEPLFERGAIRREDASSTELSLLKLLAGRVDVVFLAASGLPWWQRKLPELAARGHVASQPRSRFRRRALVSRALPAALQQALLDALARLPTDPWWRERLAQHGLPIAALATR